LAASTTDLIKSAVEGLVADVPALTRLKLVFGLELRGRGDVQVYRVELPGPKISKGLGEDERVTVAIPRQTFNQLAEQSTAKGWHQAWDHGDVKAEGDPNIQKLVGQVIAHAEARSQLRRARH
jgi:hypothetical protein